MGAEKWSIAPIYSFWRRIHLIPKALSEHGVEALCAGEKSILLSCPLSLDSMLAPGLLELGVLDAQVKEKREREKNKRRGGEGKMEEKGNREEKI